MKFSELTTDQRNQIKIRYERGEILREIAPDFGVSDSSMSDWLRRLKVQTRRQSPSEIDVENWCRQYRVGKSMYALAKEFNYNHITIRHHLLQQGVTLRDKISVLTKYTVNSEFFDNIDTPEKAYWLGFIFADGYCRRALVVQLAERDRPHLERLRAALQSSHPIAARKKKQASLFISSKHLTQSLRRFPITHEREVVYPNFNYPLDSHFIRGYNDGDGGFYSYPQMPTIFCITTKNQSFMEQLHSILLEDCNISPSPPRPTSHNSFELRWSGRQDVRKIYQYLYRDATVYLPRKRWKIHRTLLNLFPSMRQMPPSFFQEDNDLQSLDGQPQDHIV